MAELIYAIGGVVALAIGSSATNHLSDLIFSEPEDRIYARRRFGSTKKFFIASVFNVRQLRRTEDQILQGSDEAVMAFKSSHLWSIGQTSVASAIIAQLGMTTLLLPGLDSVHWTAAGFVVASLLFGVLSVIVACVQQQILGMLNDADRVRYWLSNGQHSHLGSGDGDESNHDTAMFGDSDSKPKLQASVAALLVLKLPNAFLSYGVVCFLTGLGLYLGFAYKQDLQNTPGRNNNEAVMILFLVVGIAAITEAASATGWKLWESSYAEKILEEGKDQSDSNRQGRGQKTGHEDRSKGGDDERSPLLSKASTSGGGRDAEIRQALQAMAKAHEDCAKAERRVADLMKRD